MSDTLSIFQIFMDECPEHSKAYGEFVQKLDSIISLDSKTKELGYIAVLSSAP